MELGALLHFGLIAMLWLMWAMGATTMPRAPRALAQGSCCSGEHENNSDVDEDGDDQGLVRQKTKYRGTEKTHQGLVAVTQTALGDASRRTDTLHYFSSCLCSHGAVVAYAPKQSPPFWLLRHII